MRVWCPARQVTYLSLRVFDTWLAACPPNTAAAVVGREVTTLAGIITAAISAPNVTVTTAVAMRVATALMRKYPQRFGPVFASAGVYAAVRQVVRTADAAHVDAGTDFVDDEPSTAPTTEPLDEWSAVDLAAVAALAGLFAPLKRIILEQAETLLALEQMCCDVDGGDLGSPAGGGSGGSCDASPPITDGRGSARALSVSVEPAAAAPVLSELTSVAGLLRSCCSVGKVPWQASVASDNDRIACLRKALKRLARVLRRHSAGTAVVMPFTLRASGIMPALAAILASPPPSAGEKEVMGHQQVLRVVAAELCVESTTTRGCFSTLLRLLHAMLAASQERFPMYRFSACQAASKGETNLSPFRAKLRFRVTLNHRGNRHYKSRAGRMPNGIHVDPLATVAEVESMIYTELDEVTRTVRSLCADGRVLPLC